MGVGPGRSLLLSFFAPGTVLNPWLQTQYMGKRVGDRAGVGRRQLGKEPGRLWKTSGLESALQMLDVPVKQELLP